MVEIFMKAYRSVGVRKIFFTFYLDSDEKRHFDNGSDCDHGGGKKPTFETKI